MLDEVPVRCAYCGAETTIAVDPGGGAAQRYTEDCPVCCQPWSVTVRLDEWGDASVEIERESD